MRYLVLAAALLLGGAAPASAQRFAAPDGSGTACSAGAPCAIDEAINNAPSGDEVILAMGDYGSSATPLATPLTSTQTNVDVHGTFGSARPRIFTNTLFGLELAGSGSKARHLEIHQVANGSYQSALLLESGQAEDVIASNVGGSSAAACTLLGSSELRDSVCESTGPNGYGVFPYRRSVGPVANSSIIRNATIVAPGTGGTGVYAIGGDTADKAENLTVTNTIIVPPTNTSLFAYPQTGDATITIDHSNFGFQNDLAHIHKGAGNQQLTSPPAFVAPGDYHQAAGSITIDAGATDPLNGMTDFDGDPRALGLGGTDIGADEFVPAPIVVTGDPSAVTTTAATISGSVNPDTVATSSHFEWGTTTGYGSSTPDHDVGAGSAASTVNEALSGLTPGITYHYRLVATSRGGTTIGDDRTFTTLPATVANTDTAAPRITRLTMKPRKLKRRRGARLTVTVDESGTLQFTVQRRRPGRKARYRTRGGFTKPAKQGSNALRFSGRVRKRWLSAGRYRVRVFAIDAAGNRSAPRFVTFRVLPR